MEPSASIRSAGSSSCGRSFPGSSSGGVKSSLPISLQPGRKIRTYPCISPLWTTHAPLVFNLRGEIFSALSCFYLRCHPERRKDLLLGFICHHTQRQPPNTFQYRREPHHKVTSLKPDTIKFCPCRIFLKW